ncbi:putative iron-regulated protein [Nitrosomonas sp. Nm51]|uniref:imelysin family protein n=1 Tax=Nitrosomonas sp. Nm51 TaxID=133720 RepID=UPI0008AD9F82|nr:imelysin family protein [Nitrosomonas sp. Nm51]SER58848.1 putative iron-regulated protein [Nitrosomonas sp. Nm51]
MKNRIMFIIAGMLLTTAAWAKPPATPSLYISPDGPRVHFYWDEVPGADNYTFFVSSLVDGALLGEFDMGNTNRISVTLPAGNGYYISVRAENADGPSPYSVPHRLVVSAESSTPSLEQVIQNYAGNVIYNTYRDLADRAKELSAAVDKLRLEQNDDHLAAAQKHWVTTRRPWEQSEAFLFGPVDTAGLDPAMDSWPVNSTDLQNVLDSDTALNVETVSAFNDDLKGFHVLEFLLYGVDGNKTSTDFTERELMYLGAVASVLANDTQSLAQAWSPNDGNFLAEFAQAGVGSAIYTSQSAALQEMVNGLIGIAGELASVKLEEPQRIGDATLVESQFSFNSRADFMDNVRGIRNVYTGNYLLFEGPGINALVKSVDPDLDETINNQIEAAIAAIDAIPQPFAESLLTAEVQEAINAVNALLVTLSNRLSAIAQ